MRRPIVSGLPTDGGFGRILQDRDGIDGDEAAHREQRRGHARAEIPHPAVADGESQREQTAEGHVVDGHGGEEPDAGLDGAAHQLRLLFDWRRVFAFGRRRVALGLGFRLVHRRFEGDRAVDRGLAHQLQETKGKQRADKADDHSPP